MVAQEGADKGATAGRLIWVDAAKGAGIVLVAIAHVWTRGDVRDAIYAFHMPLFFLLAGYVARPRPMGLFLRAQIWSMVIPYICFLLLITALDQWIEHSRGHLPMFRTWQGAAEAMLLGGSLLKGPFTIFWFVPCLMVARILQNALLARWPNPVDWRWVLAMGVSLGVGMWLGAETDFSPLGLLTVPVALVLLWLGMVWRALGAGRDSRLMLLAMAVSIMVFALWALGYWKIVPIDMKSGNYGMPGLSLLLAVAMSLALCGVMRLVVGWMPAQSLLVGLGRRSLVIMYCHVPVIHYAAPYFSKPVLLLLSLVASLLFYEIAMRSPWMRFLFLGEKLRPAMAR